MNRVMRIAGLLVLAAMALGTTGCRYMTNRYYDFRDIYALGAGVTAENPKTGIIPPSLGVNVEVTDWLKLGAITHNGLTAETDLRGSFAGPESYTKFGFLWWQSVYKNQDYTHGAENYFKKADTPWAYRMESLAMSHHGRPAKRLHYEYWSDYRHNGIGLLHRGWQYWGYSGVEVAICEPFLTHAGVMLRAGVDPSEIMDFVLGWTTLDFKHDDLTPDEYRHFRGIEKAAEPAAEAAPAEAAATEAGPQDAPVEGPRPGDIVPFPELKTIYFDYDKSNIRDDQQDEAKHNLDYLLANPDAHVLIEGHCDERGTIEYNLALGLRRANTVRDYFIKGGVATERITLQSYGEEQPEQPGHNEDAWKWNRRTAFKRVVTMRVQ